MFPRVKWASLSCIFRPFSCMLGYDLLWSNWGVLQIQIKYCSGQFQRWKTCDSPLNHFCQTRDANRTAALTSWKIYSARLLVTGDEGVYPAGGDRTHISATPWDAADHFLPPYSLPPRLLESISHTAGRCVFSATLSQLQFTLVMVPLCSEVADLAAGVGTVNFCGFVLTVGRHETAIQESRNCWGPLRWKSARLSFKFIVGPGPKLLAHKQCCLLYYLLLFISSCEKCLFVLLPMFSSLGSCRV